MKGNEIPEGKYQDVIYVKCRICGKDIIVRDTALHLCNSCFDEKCICGHIRAKHLEGRKTCIHQVRTTGKFCSCEKFEKACL